MGLVRDDQVEACVLERLGPSRERLVRLALAGGIMSKLRDQDVVVRDHEPAGLQGLRDVAVAVDARAVALAVRSLAGVAVRALDAASAGTGQAVLASLVSPAPVEQERGLLHPLGDLGRPDELGDARADDEDLLGSDDRGGGESRRRLA